MRLICPLLLLLTFSFISCKSQKHNFDDTKGDMITIGSGGGFAGTFHSYYISEDGLIFEMNSLDKNKIYIGQLESNIVKQLFSVYKMMHLDQKVVNNPGNMSYFLEYKTEDKTYKSVWTKDIEAGADHSLFYKNAMSFINKLKESKN